MLLVINEVLGLFRSGAIINDNDHLIILGCLGASKPSVPFNELHSNKRLGLFIRQYPCPWHTSSQVSSWPTTLVFSIIYSPETHKPIKHKINPSLRNLCRENVGFQVWCNIELTSHAFGHPNHSILWGELCCPCRCMRK